MGPYSEERQLRREKNLIRASLDPTIDDRMRNIYKSKINELARTENEYNLTVTATDSSGNTSDISITITVSDVDDSNPVITGNTTVSVQENQTAVSIYSSSEDATWTLAMAASQDPTITSAFTMFETKTPTIYMDIDYDGAQQLGVPIANINEALEIYFGSAFVNDFNYLGRTYRVTAQAENQFRMTEDDLARVRVRNKYGDMVPLGTVTTIKYASGPSRMPRYNLYPSAALLGESSPGHSSGEALNKMEELAAKVLPKGIGYEWTEVALQEKTAGNTSVYAFVFAVIFVFLLLAAQYESWILPLSVILIVPMCLLSAMTGISLLGMDNNILTQIGLVVLIGLASKNAILIVEFAKQKEDEGLELIEAVVQASELRLRPILMTAFSFILGVLPLVLATGAGAELARVRKAKQATSILQSYAKKVAGVLQGIEKDILKLEIDPQDPMLLPIKKAYICFISIVISSTPPSIWHIYFTICL